MSDEIQKTVAVRVSAEADPNLTRPFQEITKHAGEAGSAVQRMEHGLRQLGTGPGLQNVRTLDRSLMHLNAGLSGLWLTVAQGDGHLQKLAAGFMGIHSAMVAVRGAFELVRAAGLKNQAATLTAAQASQAAAVAAGKEAEAELALMQAKQAVEAIRARSLASQERDLALTLELTAAKGKQAAAEMALAQAKGAGGIAGAAGAAGGRGGLLGGLASMGGKVLTGGLYVAMAVEVGSLIKGIFDSARKEAEERQHHAAQSYLGRFLENDHFGRALGMGMGPGEMEGQGRRLLSVESEGRRQRREVLEHAAAAADRARAARMFPTRFHGNTMLGLDRAAEAYRDAMTGRNLALSAGRRDDLAGAAVNRMAAEMANPAAYLPAGLSREAYLARQALARGRGLAAGLQGEIGRLQSDPRVAADYARLAEEKKALDHMRESLMAKAGNVGLPGQTYSYWGALTTNPRNMGRYVNEQGKAAGMSPGAFQTQYRVLQQAEGEYAQHVQASPAARLLELEKQLAEQKQRNVKLSEEQLKAEKAKEEAIQKQLETWHNFASQQATFYHQAIRQLEDKIQGTKGQIGRMTRVDTGIALDVLRRIKAGGRLTQEQERFAEAHAGVMGDHLEQYHLRQFEANPLGRQLLRESGMEQKRDRLAAAERQFVKMEAELKHKIEVSIGRNDRMTQQVSNAVSKELKGIARDIGDIIANRMHLLRQEIVLEMDRRDRVGQANRRGMTN